MISSGRNAKKKTHRSCNAFSAAAGKRKGAKNKGEVEWSWEHVRDREGGEKGREREREQERERESER